ncbi:putative HTH-type transcriptional regulator, GntR family [Sulfitobacter noctilucicola]|uniref:DNA-binding GntR family transcriptional regulator n=1 Tax=Sulfitobacter noctilucicola TaxID=1342301 RepID=A0A7W6M6H5_9RHOB|nr:GntR family transcriptional regulator [Sulfitobacter noctilucicola]KIN62892.1 putative HTH-type transcriptional regulator, GntR family [Sulfitobacter noctilucicola]MBB4172577.1 DNA-binding GntR family transcriptional regulator [Sulfitobacter noctilucicola]
MATTARITERRTSVDEVFDYLNDQIISLAMLPGDKISEADIAAQFGISRQPVRDAFSRLANMDLLLIRPQRATEVRRFSMRAIEKSRFVRAAVEKEVLTRAAARCDASGAERLDAAIEDQKKAVDDSDVDGFGRLDYAFHEIICDIAGADFAFDVIMTEKVKVDRLCRLALSKEQRLPDLLSDHRQIADAIKSHDEKAAVERGMFHLSRLDETIERITASNADYFEEPDN